MKQTNTRQTRWPSDRHTGANSSVLLLLSILIIFFQLSCKKTGPGEPVDPPGGGGTPVIPAVTAVGEPTGSAVTKEIGPAGGSLASADGKLMITVPAGTVSTNTSFSIQPISAKCPNARVSYRLLPTGINFTKPITLSFPYNETDLDGAVVEMQAIAYQDVSGIWFRLPSANINTLNRTISVETKHFTDWAVVDALRIEPAGLTAVQVNKTLMVSLKGSLPDDDPRSNPVQPANNPSPADDDLPALPESIPFKATWSVNDINNGTNTAGKVTTSPSSTVATYTAPAKVPTLAIVALKAELSGYKWTSVVNGQKISFNSVTVLKQIRVAPEDMNFSVVYRTEHPGFDSSQVYTDETTMDLLLQGDSVVITNLKNNEATLVPTSIALPGGACTISASPGEHGEINVTGITGIGGLVISGAGTMGFSLKIIESDCWGINSIVACPRTLPTVQDAVALPDETNTYFFEYKKEKQVQGSNDRKKTLTITPK